MLTKPRDAFRGQSRSPNMVSFDMLGMLGVVTLSLRRIVFWDIRLDLETRIMGHSRSSESTRIDPPLLLTLTSN